MGELKRKGERLENIDWQIGELAEMTVNDIGGHGRQPISSDVILPAPESIL